MNLLDLRFIVEQDIKDTLDNMWVINKCNDAQSEFGLNINIPDTAQIEITPEELEYPLPEGLKTITRLWLQSDFDHNIDKPFVLPYRVYNGNIIFRRPWVTTDILNIDYYRHMTFYTDINQELDLEDRFSPLYASYIQREYYDSPDIKARLGETQARREWEKHNGRYIVIQRQVISYYSIPSEDVISERW